MGALGGERATSWGEQLRSWREDQAGWSQREFCERYAYHAGHLGEYKDGKLAEVTTKDLWRWENGKTRRIHYQNRRVLQDMGAPLPATGRLEASPPTASAPAETLIEEEPDVPASRRQVFRGLAALGVLAAGRELAPGASLSSVHYERALTKLVESDNFFGPADVIPIAERHVALIESALSEARGQDLLDLRRVQTKFSELCSWLYHDAGRYREAQGWINVALNRSLLIGDESLTSYILSRQSQLAGDVGDARTAVDSADAAVRIAPDDKLKAVGLVYGAHGKAMMSDDLGSERSYDEAKACCNRVAVYSEWAPWLDDSYVDIHRAHSLAALGEFRPASLIYGSALDGLSPEFHRDRGVYLARLGLTLASLKEPEAAVDRGIEAVAVAAQTKSFRIMSDLSRIVDVVTQYDERSAQKLRRVMIPALHGPGTGAKP